MALPFLTSLYLETVNILNQYEIFVKSPRKIFSLCLFLFLCFTAVCYLILCRLPVLTKWRAYAYPLLLVGFACLACQIPLQQQKDISLFEGANSSILVSDFLLFGKIPIVEHYGGHMLKKVIGSILYAAFNQDYAGAVFSPYEKYIYVMTVLFFYGFLKELLQKEDNAFFYTLCLPFGGAFSYINMGLLVCIAAAGYVRKHGYGRALLIWLACAAAVLYRLDLGTAFGIAAVFTLALYLLKVKENQYAKELILTFVSVVVSGVSLFALLCIRKGISPIGRILEFIFISLSNQNWAAGMLGDKYSVYFSLVYAVIPLACVGALLYLIVQIQRNGRDNSAGGYMIILLGFAYFANFSRGLVRHTMNELAVITILFSGLLFLIAFFYYVGKKEAILVGSAIFFLVFLKLAEHTETFAEMPLIEQSAVKMESFIGKWGSDLKGIDEKKERIQMAEGLAETVQSHRELFEMLLAEDETYLDFMNVTFLYSALKKECPVYIAQSPGHLSGEYTQEAFIREIEEKRQSIPLAILPAGETNSSLDGIANASRYYKVAEYIYQNYRPLCRFDNVAVWCHPERYGQFVSKLEEADYEFIDYGYDKGDIEFLHNYPMYRLPYIWGSYDSKEAWNNLSQGYFNADGAGGYYLENPQELHKEKGNYLLMECCYEGENGEANGNMEIMLGSSETGEEDLYRFRLELRPGMQRYLIRISADYYWYAENIDTLHFQADGEVTQVRMEVLEGD